MFLFALADESFSLLENHQAVVLIDSLDLFPERNEHLLPMLSPPSIQVSCISNGRAL